MKCWLSRRRIGVYMLTQWHPRQERLEHRGPFDWYAVPGDPLSWTAAICGATVKRLVGRSLRRMECVQVELSICEVKDAT